MTAKTLTRWYGTLLNGRMRNILATNASSRLHKTHLLLSFNGRKSGKQYTIPVNYRLTERKTYAIGTEAGWRHNFTQPNDVEILVDGLRIVGRGVVLEKESPLRDQFGRQLASGTWWLFSKSLTIIEITPADT